jgi:hypothetical protein
MEPYIAHKKEVLDSVKKDCLTACMMKLAIENVNKSKDMMLKAWKEN